MCSYEISSGTLFPCSKALEDCCLWSDNSTQLLPIACYWKGKHCAQDGFIPCICSFCLMCCFSVFVKLRKLLIRTSISWHCSHDICYYHPFFTNYSNYTYRHLLVITGYKLDYTYYKWGFCTYNCYFGHCSKTHHENKQRRKNTRFNYNKSASWLLTPGHWLSDVCSKAFHLREGFFLPIPKAWTCRHRLATNFRDEHFLMAIYQL